MLFKSELKLKDIVLESESKYLSLQYFISQYLVKIQLLQQFIISFSQYVLWNKIADYSLFTYLKSVFKLNEI